jgi:hypothetical protein
MGRCTTTHGPYRCVKESGHSDDCEQADKSGVLSASGRELDRIGDEHGVKRNGDEDRVYRARIWAA